MKESTIKCQRYDLSEISNAAWKSYSLKKCPCVTPTSKISLCKNMEIGVFAPLYEDILIYTFVLFCCISWTTWCRSMSNLRDSIVCILNAMKLNSKTEKHSCYAFHFLFTLAKRATTVYWGQQGVQWIRPRWITRHPTTLLHRKSFEFWYIITDQMFHVRMLVWILNKNDSSSLHLSSMPTCTWPVL